MQEEARQGKHIPRVDSKDAEIELFPSFLTAPAATQTDKNEKEVPASLYVQSPPRQERSELENGAESEESYEEHPGERLQTLFSGLKGRGIESSTDEQMESISSHAPENDRSLTSQVDNADFDIDVAELMNFSPFEDELNFGAGLSDREDKEQFSKPGFDEDFNDLEMARQLEELEKGLGFEVDLSNLEITKQPNIFEDDLSFADSLLNELENVAQSDELKNAAIAGTQLEIPDNPFEVEEQTTGASTYPYKPLSFDEQDAEVDLTPFSFNTQSADAFADPFAPSSMEAKEDGANTLLLNTISAPAALMSEAQTVQIAQTDITNNPANMAQFAGVNNNQSNNPPVAHIPQGFTKVYKSSSARLVSIIAVIVAILIVASLVFVLNKGNSTVKNKEHNITGQTISIDVGKPTGLLTPTNVATIQAGHPTATAADRTPSTTDQGTTASGVQGNTQNTAATQVPSSSTTTGAGTTTGSGTGSGTTAPPAGSAPPSPPTQAAPPPPPPAPVFTSFTGGSIGSYDTNVDLTSTGGVDWAHWGGASAGNETRMIGAANVISGVSWNSSIANDTNQSNDFTWSNGTSPGSVSAYTSGTAIKGGSASFTVKTSSIQHTLRVYVGSYLSQGTLTITLNGKNAYSGSWDMSHNSSNAGDNTMFTFIYRTNVDSQFTVTYAMTKSDGSSSYIMLEAAAVS